MPIFLASFLVPKNGNTYALIDDIYIKGGFRSVANLADRSALDPTTLKEGMLVLTVDTGLIYKLGADLTTWTETALKGDTGDTGAQGLKGDTGDAGPQGLKGDTGDTGPAGLQGVKGDAGDPGPQGVAGPKGDTGNTGPQGLKGDTGDTGPAGPQGPAGQDGADYDPMTTVLALPYDLSLFVQGGLYETNQPVMSFIAPRIISLKSGLAGSLAKAAIAPVGPDVVYSLTVNGVQKGTLTFATSSTNGVFSWTQDVNLQIGDILRVVTPATIEAVIQDVSVCIVGAALAPNQTMIP